LGPFPSHDLGLAAPVLQALLGGHGAHPLRDPAPSLVLELDAVKRLPLRNPGTGTREIRTSEVVSKLGAWNWFSLTAPGLGAPLGGKPFLALILKPPHWY
jgi:hypothetical protein